jgi:hypothetical protein
MAFNGSGTFVRLYNWVVDKGNAVPITASRMDDEQDGIATGLSNCITKDGQTTITANIPFNAKKITGLLAGSALTDSINLSQVQDGQFTYYGATGGTADNYTLSPSPTLTATNLGFFIFQASATSNAGADMDISGRGVENLHKSDGAGSTVAIEASDMISGSRYYAYDNATNIILLNPEKPFLNLVNSGGATETAKGSVELLTNADTAAATDTTKAMTASNLASLFGTSLRSANGYIRLPVKVGGVFVEMIVQFGTQNIASNTTVNVTLPLAFPTIQLKSYATIRRAALAGDAAQCYSNEQSTSQVRLTNDDSSAQDINFLSIGY